MKIRKTTGQELAVAVGLGVMGSIPGIGALIQSTAQAFILDERKERIEKLLGHLEVMLVPLDEERLNERLQDPEFIDLLQDGFVGASRALNEERIKFIASLLKNSLFADRLQHIIAKRMLSILNQLSDAEVLILLAYGGYIPKEEGLWDKIGYDALDFPECNEGEAKIYRHTLHNSMMNRLVELQLLMAATEIETLHGIRTSRGHYTWKQPIAFSIAPLGTLLLSHIDAAAKASELFDGDNAPQCTVL